MMLTLRRWLAIVLLLLAVALVAAAAEPVKPRFASQVITSQTPGHAVDVDVDITGAKQLYLVVTDGGNGYGCDWADWAEPRLVGPRGEMKLTDIKWKSASSGWGQVRTGQNTGGGPLKINGQPVAYGIGTHATSLIVYDLPEGFTRFMARAGLDNGGTNQAGGGSSSVQFLVFVQRPPAKYLASSSGGGGPQGGHEPEDALDNLDVAEGLGVSLFASEPMISSLTNIDIDHRGRVWACDVVNYRGRRGSRPEGDRIMILEDTDGDGTADRSKVFYQGTDIDSAHGICVLGNRVIVTCSPNVFVFIDDNGDDKPDRRELLFTKTGPAQNDHNAHAFHFGPDGRLYWNMGNAGGAVHDRDGNPVVDMSGNPVRANGKPYRDGMALRCNPDGSRFEVLGHNFRNNWMVVADAFGTAWQSDNDDDGNQGCRLNYVMEYGNFGYKDELTGTGWQTERTGMHPEKPLRHWHANDPGVVPNLLGYGNGSPVGICIYEGDLLGEMYRGALLHCEARVNAVNAHPLEDNGAGYATSIEPLLVGTRDRWFRPSDVKVAPDGSVIVADWYDPGVGGHGMGDIDRGRLFRIAPPDTPYRVPPFNFGTPDGAAAALQNPCPSVRYLAWTALYDMQQRAEPALLKIYRSANPRFRARALWLLARIEGRGVEHVEVALRDRDSNIRITALRAARQLELDVIPYVRQLVRDRSPQVRRECAITLRHNPSPDAATLWAELARQHDGKDRWYIEALGIGADRQWDPFFAAWQALVGNGWNTPAGRDIVWRSRAQETSKYLTRIITDTRTTRDELPRYFRAFDFQPRGARDVALFDLAFSPGAGGEPDRRAFIELETVKRMRDVGVGGGARQQEVLGRVVDRIRGTAQFVELVDRFHLTDRYGALLDLARRDPRGEAGMAAIGLLLAQKQTESIEKALADGNLDRATATAEVLGTAADGRGVPLLLPLVDDDARPLTLRGQAVKSLGKIRAGAETLLSRADANQLDPLLLPYAAAALNQVVWPDLKERAAKRFPPPPAKNDQPLPPLDELVRRRGSVERGREVFEKAGTCIKCHKVRGQGDEIGPELTEIGSKLSREGLLEAVVYPSAGINLNYEAYVIETEDGNQLVGIIADESGNTITLKSADFITRKIKKADVVERAKQTISMMPADLSKMLTADELVDLVEYLATLRKAN